MERFRARKENAEMTEKPILFNGDMVRAILDGRKTQTRRIVKDVGFYAIDSKYHGEEVAANELKRLSATCSFGKIGYHLWVRENYCFQHYEESEAFVTYHADGKIDKATLISVNGKPKQKQGTHPSIHMPRWASRIQLEITDVRVERLNDISEADALAEGVEGYLGNYKDYSGDIGFAYANSSYRTLWESINGIGSWQANPFVWVIEFKRI